MTEHTEVGKRFFDHVRINYDTQYDYDTPEEAIEAFKTLALQQREEARATGDQGTADFYSGFLKRCD
jgi:hypothetical protein